MASAAFTEKVKALRTRLHVWRTVWQCCSSLQGTALRRRRALPAGAPDAHSGAFNGGFWDELAVLATFAHRCRREVPIWRIGVKEEASS